MLERTRSLLPALLAIAAAACSSAATASNRPAEPVEHLRAVEPGQSTTPERPITTSASSAHGRPSREPVRAGKRVLSRQTGSATYYGHAFDGRLTASGERYDPRAFTAAHRKLPFGTVVRVVRLDDPSKVVYVTINDRGPHGSKKRVIDLSNAAASKLGMLRDGIVAVRLEVVEYGKR